MTDKTTPLYVVCSPCRGVGKTLVSRLLTEFHAIDDRPVVAFDLADEGPQLADYLPHFTTVVDIGNTRGQMALFDRLIADQDAAKIIDLSHRAFNNFFEVVETTDFFEEARRRSIEPLILFVIAPDPKSARAYSMLRSQFTAASLMPVRNQTAAVAIRAGNASPNASMVPALLDVPILGSPLQALADREEFSFSRFWRTTQASLPVPLDDELSMWMDHIFFQFRELELWLACEEPSTPLAAPGEPISRTTRRPRLQDDNFHWDGKGMLQDQHPIDIPRQVLEFAPKKMRRLDGGPVDQFGDTIVTMLKEAADRSNDDRTMADELSRELRAAEDRISQLEREVECFQDRAVRAEAWLQHIQQAIEQEFIVPAATHTKSTTPSN